MFRPGRGPDAGLRDVMLTGLCPRRRPYVPEAWPQLSREAIAGFFGRPYWEVAVDVIRPFAAGEIIRCRSRPHGERGLRDFPPSGGRSARPDRPNQFLLELFHGPTLAFKDVAMQLICAADGSRAGEAVAAHHDRGGDLGRYRRRRGRGASPASRMSIWSCCSRTGASPRCSGG